MENEPSKAEDNWGERRNKGAEKVLGIITTLQHPSLSCKTRMKLGEPAHTGSACTWGPIEEDCKFEASMYHRAKPCLKN